MANLTLVLVNTTGSPVTITDASGVIVPASGSDTYSDMGMLLQLAASFVLQGFVAAGTIVVNNGVSNLSVAAGLQYLAQIFTQASYTSLPQPVNLYQMQVGSALSAVTLPLSGCGIEIVQSVKTLILFQGRRGTPGTSGTTTVQLEINGVAVVGATLSWTPADAAFALKSVAINQAVNIGDRLSMLLSSAEAGGQDVLTEVS